MKTTNWYLLITLAITSIFGWACTEESNLDPEGEWTLSDVSLKSPEDNQKITLNEAAPNELLSVSWAAAVSSKGYQVTYAVSLDSADATDENTPILSIPVAENGTELSTSIAHAQIDEALSLKGYKVGTEVSLVLKVVASSMKKKSIDQRKITVKRFSTDAVPEKLFLAGAASETGVDVSAAYALKRLNNAEGKPSNNFEIYTKLLAGKTFKLYSQPSTSGHVYGGANGQIVKSGEGISVEEEAVYRVSVNLDSNRYQLTKIDYWSVVGSPISGGWGGDQPLTYKGNGLFEASMDFVETGGFIFRANGDWGLLLKKVVGSTNEVVLESDAESQGLAFEDMQAESKGGKIVKLDLSAGAYTYSVEKDPNAIGPIEAPATLFLLADGTKIAELVKDGETFSTNVYLALSSGVDYTLNSAEDGSGTAYAIDINLGVTDNAGGDKVEGISTVSEGESTAFKADIAQMYSINIDFSASKLFWKFYNIKLFHWSDWDSRDEFVMTYEAPNKFTVTADLKAGFDMKFNSPWDIELGSETPAATSGALLNKGGENLKCITADGKYQVVITVSEDYSTGTYEFISQ